MPTYTTARYLESKRTVDDRALNKDVLKILCAELEQLAPGPRRVFEVGAGIGTMVTRLLEWRVLRQASYTLLDEDSELLNVARQRLLGFASTNACSVEELSDGLRLRSAELDLTAHFVDSELSTLLATGAGPSGADLLIANAFLDLVDVPATLPLLFRRARPQGLFWFCINFDGESIFLPEHPADRELLEIYHRSMDERLRDGRRAGDSKTGRHLFAELARAGARLLAAGASDWVVHPSGAGYPADEAHFLGHLIHTVERELGAHASAQPALISSWVADRSSQLARGELHFIAHQLDFCGRVGS
jgi:hypothetical protein